MSLLFIILDGVIQLSFRVVQAVPLPILNIESVRSLILFDNINKPHLYPADTPMSSKPPPVYIYIADPTNGLFRGFTVDVPISGKVRTSSQKYLLHNFMNKIYFKNYKIFNLFNRIYQLKKFGKYNFINLLKL